MPISVEELRKKHNDNMLSRNTLFHNDDVNGMLDILELINAEKKSYLCGKLGKYVTAINRVRDPRSYNTQELNAALNTLSGFGDFLKASNNGKTNYRRLMDDIKLIKTNEYYPEMTINSGISFASDYLGMDYKLEDIRNAKPGPEPLKETRERRTTPATTYEELLEERDKGVNFLVPNSKESKTMHDYTAKMELLAGSLNNAPKKELNDIGKKLSETAIALELLRVYPDKPEKNEADRQQKKEKVEEALKTVNEFKTFLNEGDPTNYQIIVAAGKESKAMAKYELDGCLGMVNNALGTGFNPEQAIKDNKAKKTVSLGSDEINNIKSRVSSGEIDLNVADNMDIAVAHVFAVRILTNSTPGNYNSLKKEITKYDFDNTLKDLNKNKNFREFLQEIHNDPKKMKQVKEDFKSNYSHGGGVEKMFKEYLLKRPAGELVNSPEIARFMPRVIDRIEELQKQAEAKRKADKSGTYVPDAEMAETILLRKAIGVEHKQKDKLRVQIPADNSLKNVNILAKNTTFRNNFAVKEENIKKFYDGHGGKMLEEYKAKNNPGEQKAQEQAKNNPVM